MPHALHPAAYILIRGILRAEVDLTMAEKLRLLEGNCLPLCSDDELMPEVSMLTINFYHNVTLDRWMKLKSKSEAWFWFCGSSKCAMFIAERSAPGPSCVGSLQASTLFTGYKEADTQEGWKLYRCFERGM